ARGRGLPAGRVGRGRRGVALRRLPARRLLLSREQHGERIRDGILLSVVARLRGRLAEYRQTAQHCHQSFSTLQTNALPSWIDTFGSPTKEVSSLTTSPRESPIHPQCQGMPTW